MALDGAPRLDRSLPLVTPSARGIGSGGAKSAGRGANPPKLRSAVKSRSLWGFGGARRSLAVLARRSRPGPPRAPVRSTRGRLGPAPELRPGHARTTGPVNGRSPAPTPAALPNTGPWSTRGHPSRARSRSPSPGLRPGQRAVTRAGPGPPPNGPSRSTRGQRDFRQSPTVARYGRTCGNSGRSLAPLSVLRAHMARPHRQ